MSEGVDTPPHVGVLRDRVLAWAGVAQAAAAALGEAKAADGDERVHDFRVSLRRLRSVLRWFEPSFGRRAMRVLADELRGVAALTGELRDEEVMRETLRELPLELRHRVPLDAWMAGRLRREHGLRARALRDLRAAGLGPLLGRLGARLRGPLDLGYDDRALADGALAAARDKVVRRAEGLDLADGEAAHRLRIAWKQLRYTAELCDGVAGSETHEDERTGAKLQKHLGRLHDLDQARLRMSRARGLAAEPRAEVFAALGHARAKAATRAGRELAEALERLRRP